VLLAENSGNYFPPICCESFSFKSPAEVFKDLVPGKGGNALQRAGRNPFWKEMRGRRNWVGEVQARNSEW